MSTQLTIVRGSSADFPLQVSNRGGMTTPVFQATDTTSGYVYRGEDEAQLFALTTGWYTAGGTQTGFDQGQVLASIAASDSDTLEAGANYGLQVWWSPADRSRMACIWRGILSCEPAAGIATPTILPYCTYQDVLDVAPWVRTVQDPISDEAEFYSQRKQAREWLDWCILNCYRGAFVGLFETHSTAAFEFGYAGWRRSLGPSHSLIGYLQQNFLIIRPQIIKVTAHWAASLIGLAQIGINPQQLAQGLWHRDEAERQAAGITAEVDLNADGIGELFISLDSTNTLFT